MARKAPLGLLSPSNRPFQLRTQAPCDALAPWIDYFWIVDWDLPRGRTYTSENLSHPLVHLVFDPPRSGLFGPVKGCFHRTLSGKGQVIGVRFKAGMFRAFYPAPLVNLTNQVLDCQCFLPVSTAQFDDWLLAEADPGSRISRLESWLMALAPQADTRADLANRVVNAIATEAELLKVEQVCEVFGVTQRSLERLFRDYVGLSPKWVVRCHRLQQAADRIVGGNCDLTGLAHSLGYYDQTHFIKDFKSATGKVPGSYRPDFKP